MTDQPVGGSPPDDVRSARTGTPGERPPPRLLERAPSERLAAPAAASAATRMTRGSAARAFSLGAVAAAGGAAAHVFAATWLDATAALLVIATTLGIAAGLAAAFGGGTRVAPRVRRSVALVLGIGGLVAAFAVNWALSGMYLGPLDYLAQVYGLLVPAQLALAAAGAIAGAR